MLLCDVVCTCVVHKTETNKVYCTVMLLISCVILSVSLYQYHSTSTSKTKAINITHLSNSVRHVTKLLTYLITISHLIMMSTVFSACSDRKVTVCFSQLLGHLFCQPHTNKLTRFKHVTVSLASLKSESANVCVCVCVCVCAFVHECVCAHVCSMRGVYCMCVKCACI